MTPEDMAALGFALTFGRGYPVEVQAELYRHYPVISAALDDAYRT